MSKPKSALNYFSAGELILWCSSIFLIVASFSVFDRTNYTTLTASVIGATSLIFTAKGNPIGQLFMVIFSIMYGIISYTFSYYGEMVTYLGMTAPMTVFSLVSWLRNPFSGNHAEVKVNSIKKHEIVFMLALTAIVTAVFFFVLDFFQTANIIPSTLSVATSFLAVYLIFRRSAYYALAYAANDIVLIVLWALATVSDISYLSVAICFVMFLANDIYGFVNWLKMQRRQKNICLEEKDHVSGDEKKTAAAYFGRVC